MRTIYTSIKPLICLLFITGLAACTDGNEWETDPSKAALFRVRNVDVPDNRVAAQTASVSWTATSTAEYYIIEVSTAPLSDDIEMGTAQNSIVYGEDKSITSVPAMITHLTKESTYYLRVKSFGNGMQSGWAYLDGSFTTTSEDILQKEFAEGDITAESIRVRWNDAGLPVTHLIYEWEVSVGNEVSTEEATYELSEEEISAQSAVIIGLQPGMKYNIYIYNNDDLRGITEATTEQILNSPEILGGTVTLRWADNGIPVTKLTYYPAGENTNSTEYELTAQEISAGSATISGLTLDQSYTFMIYNGESMRGVTTATTEQIMTIDEAEVRGRSVTVVWDDNETPVTKLTYQTATSEEVAWTEELSATGTNVTGLEGLTEYTFRVYTGDVLRGERTVTTLAPMIDVTITAGITKATFTWEVDEAVTSYSCTKEGENAQIVVLTDEAKNNGTITINNLTGNTNYTFTLYNASGDPVSNEQSFTTQADPLDGYVKVYLPESPTIEEWNAIWTDENNTGKVAIILAKNTNYGNMSGNSNYTYSIPEKITSLAIWGGEDGQEFSEAEKPVIGFRKLSFMASTVDKVEFFNVVVESNGSSNYIIRQAHAVNIKELIFRSCKMQKAASVFVARDGTASGGSCQQITIDNCNISDIGNYNVIGVQNNIGFTIQRIQFTNSTVNGCTGNIFRIEQNNTPFEMTIDKCTFYNSNQAFIRSTVTTNPVTISNTVISTVNTTAHATMTNLGNVYTTSDCYGVNWAEKTSYDAATLFPNAASGDFTVGVPELKVYGDPRWNNE